MKDYFRPEIEESRECAKIGFRARIVLTLIERWGMVAGEIDGEDSAGRSKIKLQTPEELIERAFKVAELFVARAEAEGILMANPWSLMSDQEIGERMGALEHARSHARWPRFKEAEEQRPDKLPLA